MIICRRGCLRDAIAPFVTNEVKKVVTDYQYYNLNGQRVAQPTKGVYIVNGKKIIIK